MHCEHIRIKGDREQNNTTGKSHTSSVSYFQTIVYFYINYVAYVIFQIITCFLRNKQYVFDMLILYMYIVYLFYIVVYTRIQRKAILK